ncbi:MAG: ATP synthase F1 subunit delta [Verrucomicrobia bacterium]|nr:ATP synthase F1 subunit delta [Verrucomicrobiota bacterium]
MGNYALVVRYVHALLQGLPSEEVGQVQEDISAAAELWRLNETLRRVMLNPFIPSGEKRGAMDRIAERAQWHERVRGLLGVLVDNERAALLAEVAPVVAESVRARLQREIAVVETPVALGDNEIEGLLKRLGQRLGVTLVPQVEVQPELIAGLRVRVGDTRYDATVAGNLESLREELGRGHAW